MRSQNCNVPQAGQRRGENRKADFPSPPASPKNPPFIRPGKNWSLTTA